MYKKAILVEQIFIIQKDITKNTSKIKISQGSLCGAFKIFIHSERLEMMTSKNVCSNKR